MNLELLKYKIKNNHLLNYLYIKFGTAFILIQYKYLFIYYQNKQLQYSFEKLLIKKGFTDNWKNKFINRKPIVFFVGNDEYQDRSGFIQELKKVVDTLYLFHKEDGSYGTYHYGSFNYKKNNAQNENIILKILKNCETTKKIPDILLLQAWGWNISLETLQKIKYLYPTIKIVNIAMDERHSFWLYGRKKLGTAGLFPAIDLVLSTSSETVDWCLKENTPAVFFPLGSSLDFFYPMDIEKKYAIGFVGAKYGIREKIVNALVQNGIKVEAYGNGWKNGKLPLQDTNKFFNECEIILGIGTIAGCENFYNMKLRDFDALMSGGVYLTHNNVDLRKLFDDRVVLCDSVDDFVKNAQYLLEHKKLLQLIRKKAFNIAKNEYTYEKSFLRVFRTLGIYK